MLVLGSSLLLLMVRLRRQLLCQWLRKLPGRLQQPMLWPMFPGPSLLMPLARIYIYIYTPNPKP